MHHMSPFSSIPYLAGPYAQLGNSVVQQKCIGNCVGPMIKFRSMAIHLSALKFVGLQLKKNIPYRVH